MVHPKLKFVSNHIDEFSIEVLEVRYLEFEVAEQMLLFIVRSLLRAKKIKLRSNLHFLEDLFYVDKSLSLKSEELFELYLLLSLDIIQRLVDAALLMVQPVILLEYLVP